MLLLPASCGSNTRSGCPCLLYRERTAVGLSQTDRQSSTCVPSLQNIPLFDFTHFVSHLCVYVCVCVRIFERWPLLPGDIAATIILVFQSRIKCTVKLKGMGFIGIRAPQSSGSAQHGPQSTPKAPTPPPPPPPGLYPGLKINRGHSFFFFFFTPRVYTRQVPVMYLLSIRRKKKINKCHACCLGPTPIINPPTHPWGLHMA